MDEVPTFDANGDGSGLYEVTSAAEAYLASAPTEFAPDDVL